MVILSNNFYSWKERQNNFMMRHNSYTTNLLDDAPRNKVNIENFPEDKSKVDPTLSNTHQTKNGHCVACLVKEDSGCTAARLVTCPDDIFCPSHVPYCRNGICSAVTCVCNDRKSLGNLNCHYLLRSPCNDTECAACCDALPGLANFAGLVKGGYCEGGERGSDAAIALFEEANMTNDENVSEIPGDCYTYLAPLPTWIRIDRA
eukprot:993672-Amphidinium_carterae.1